MNISRAMGKKARSSKVLNAKKVLPVYFPDDPPNIDDIVSVKFRDLPTGMMREEESQHHLQRAISTQQIDLIHGDTERHLIPIPGTIPVESDYNQLKKRDVVISDQLIQDVLEDDISSGPPLPGYDCDEEDKQWLFAQNQMNMNGMFSILEFESIMETLENGRRSMIKLPESLKETVERAPSNHPKSTESTEETRNNSLSSRAVSTEYIIKTDSNHSSQASPMESITEIPENHHSIKIGIEDPMTLNPEKEGFTLKDAYILLGRKDCMVDACFEYWTKKRTRDAISFTLLTETGGVGDETNPYVVFRTRSEEILPAQIPFVEATGRNHSGSHNGSTSTSRSSRTRKRRLMYDANKGSYVSPS